MHTYLYLANWKMYVSHTQTKQWLAEHTEQLNTHAHNNIVVIFPSFTAIELVAKKLTKSAIAWGAQDCSAHTSGAYTGQVSAQSLAELGCTYCIVGHSELRTWQSNDDSITKVQQLIAHHITPVLCISQPTPQQLAPALYALERNAQIVIAYEPLAAIGSGHAASLHEINHAIATITDRLKLYQRPVNYQILYGGSVSETNAGLIKSNALIDGFLVGRASIDAQKFIDIITSPAQNPPSKN